ncbi:hypothetical protein D3C81_1580960 [compost metagenome]
MDGAEPFTVTFPLAWLTFRSMNIDLQLTGIDLGSRDDGEVHAKPRDVVDKYGYNGRSGRYACSATQRQRQVPGSSNGIDETVDRRVILGLLWRWRLRFT